MTPFGFHDHIAHLRVRGGSSDPLLAQQRINGLLNGVELRASSLPPSAILCVRRLRDPLPGAMNLNGYAARPPRAWEDALNASLDALARRAVRPIRQAVPADADAVVFADHAELLACLASDWARGTLTYHWWWGQWISAFEPEQGVWRMWAEMPHCIPAALGHLAARQEAVEVVRRMDETSTRALLEALLAVFELRALASILTGEIAIPRSVLSTTRTDGYAASEGNNTPTSDRPVLPPWRQTAPESVTPGSLSLEGRLLLGIGLTLARNPIAARSAAFAAAAQAYWQAATGQGNRMDTATLHTAQTSTPSRPVQAISRDHGDAPQQDVGSPSSSVPPDDKALSGHATTQHLATVDATAPPALAAVADESRGEVPPPVEMEIRTAFGGVFYLVNLALYLGFYTDYRTPELQPLDLPLWDFVALVGAELLGGMRTDPVWTLLAALANRPVDEPPGMQFAAPATWQIPPAWLGAFPEAAALSWSVEAGRLRVRHPAGFLMVDETQPAHAAARVAEIAQTYGQRFTVVEAEITETVSVAVPLRRWLNWLLPYIRLRLMRALKVEKDIGAFVCAYPARVIVTGAHVDVILNLDVLPIEIRLTGLDRNPGWLPSAGRAIAFHFEQHGG